MRLLKWYTIALTVGALILTALLYVLAYRHYRQLDQSAFSSAWVHESVAFDVSDVISGASFVLLGLTFVVGLLESLRASESSAISLAPALLVLVVGAVVTVAGAISWYGVVSTNEIDPLFAASVNVQEVAYRLGVAIALGGVLFSVVVFKARRAT